MPSRRCRPASFLVLAAATGGCLSVGDSADSAAAARAVAAAIAADSTKATLGRGNTASIASPAASDSPGSPVGDVPVNSNPPVDNSSVVVTDAEIPALGAVLTIPVQGVRPTDLRDTYNEPRGGRVHEALDIPAPRGTPVLSASDGKLLKLHNSKPGGLMVYAADATDRFIFMYGHLDRYADGLSEGMMLRRGQVIGYVGTTGNAPPATPHLHFVISRGQPSVSWWKGTPINPYPLLAR